MPFEEDLSDLSSAEKERFWDEYTDLGYEWEDFHKEVVRALRGYYGRDNLEIGEKAIKVDSNDETPIPIDADVVACAEYRKYHKFTADGEEEYTSGMYFKTKNWLSREIVNYSKEHKRNGEEKNQEENTDGEYKRTIRMFKNARNRAVEYGILDGETASSYYLEGLLYNVPDDYFTETDLPTRYLDIVDWLDDADVSSFSEQSGMYSLCVDGDPDRWTVEDANATIEAFQEVWDSY
ncbi:hypothetical protein [Halobacterium litoreum]|uniref:cGAS/DncV-like nucleotidyltransferase C-terminal helical domain-containing protein n=1 Tax=Halobacterium litoreum TaxID=2039234 RepID=A0ABD5NA34_9EURY|nr:hypothetical protein [Halobacterium litoreum]UHH14815.1 hypothetical protein LT972_07370 [Halobacterium litoreum]